MATEYTTMYASKTGREYSAAAENSALDQARAELPGASLSELMQRAAVIAAERRLQKQLPCVTFVTSQP